MPGPRTLWTPDGNRLLDDVQRQTGILDSREMLILRSVHTIAQRHRLVLACADCRQPFQGLNSGHADVESISCGCRELKATGMRRVIALA